MHYVAAENHKGTVVEMGHAYAVNCAGDILKKLDTLRIVELLDAECANPPNDLPQSCTLADPSPAHTQET